MKQSWRLKVTDFAKIKKASIQMNDFVCFVGENNSGKSYLLSLLWGVLTFGKDLFPTTPPKSAKYMNCLEWMRKNENKSSEVNAGTAGLFVDWFNDILRSKKNILVAMIFNHPVDLGKLSVSDYSRSNKLKIIWKEDRTRCSSTADSIVFPAKKEYSDQELYFMNKFLCWNMLMYDIAGPLTSYNYNGRISGEPVYLPASRTGFMLTYSMLVDQSFKQVFGSESEEKTTLTAPYVDFLRLITQFDTSEKNSEKNRDLIRFAENELTRGNFNVRKSYLPEISYSPEDGVNLPLYLSSSVITETSPLVLLLLSNIKFNTIIIEEPEAHLHPALQQKMAQLLVRMKNAGYHIFVSTHSDIILQHFNNMIKLEANKNRNSLMAETGYEGLDLLSSETIDMYEFKNDGKNSTHIEKLMKTPFGFVVPTFNEALADLNDETFFFQEGEEE